MNKLLPRYYATLLRRNMCSVPSGPKDGPDKGLSMTPKYRPSDFQKFILVWTKKYKSKAEIPDLVTVDLIERSRSEARIKIANVLMALTALASLGAILSGKAAARRGESVHQMNLDWHKQYEEEHAKAEATASKK